MRPGLCRQFQGTHDYACCNGQADAFKCYSTTTTWLLESGSAKSGFVPNTTR